MSAKGGITKGKSHKEGGIPMVVKSTGQQVELEGGEGVINKRNMASEKTFEFEGKEKTICEIASEINSADGNGVKIDCNNITGKKYEYATGGKILDEDQEDSFKEWMDDGNVIEFEKGVYSTQDAQYSNKLKGMDELRKYFKKEFLSDSYAKGGWVLYDEDTEKLIKVFPTESEARKSLYEYEGNANIVEKSNWDKSNKYEGGGNIEWSKAKIGDSARVKSENKMGLIMKDYGRKFHLRFADDTEKTYDASELDFYRFDDEDDALYEGGGGVENTPKSFQIKRKRELGIINEYLLQAGGKKMEEQDVEFVLNYYKPEHPYQIVDKVLFLSGANEEVLKVIEKRRLGEALMFFKHKEKMEDGGDVRDMSWYQDFKKQELKRGTEHEMEHIDTIKKFKKKGVSDREVAKAIAKDHLDEDENYYIELEKMEEKSRELSEALDHYKKHKSRKKNIKKFDVGGYMGQNEELIYVNFIKDVKTDLYTLNGRYFSERTYPKGRLFVFNFISNNGISSKLEIPMTGVYAEIPNDAFEVVGYDEKKYGNGGNVKPQFNSLNISDNDKKILSVLRTINEENATHQQREFISNFRGDNVVNELSKQVISKIYGLLFEWHNIQNPIHNILIENVGVGNMASMLPMSIVQKIGIEFDSENTFSNTERLICSIVNSSIRFVDYDAYDLQLLDAIVKVYPKTNPENDTLVQRLFNTKNKSIILGVAEFTSMNELNHFRSTIKQNMGSFAQNQMFLPESMNFAVINEGITNKAKYTLIYGVTKY